MTIENRVILIETPKSLFGLVFVAIVHIAKDAVWISLGIGIIAGKHFGGNSSEGNLEEEK